MRYLIADFLSIHFVAILAYLDMEDIDFPSLKFFIAACISLLIASHELISFALFSITFPNDSASIHAGISSIIVHIAPFNALAFPEVDFISSMTLSGIYVAAFQALYAVFPAIVLAGVSSSSTIHEISHQVPHFLHACVIATFPIFQSPFRLP